MPAHQNNRIVASKPQAQERALQEYWTPKRRAAAKPVPPPKPPKAGEVEREPQRGIVAGHLPSSRPVAERQDFEAPMLAGGQPVPSPTSYPYCTCGKLFFSRGGSDYMGSASVVARNIILTAGHCLYEGGWSTNVVFYPAYPDLPAISFSYNYIAVWSAWANNGDRAYDYGMIWVDNNPGDAVGWLGLLWNANTSGRTWNAVGYPALPNPPFDGGTMDQAAGTYAGSGGNDVIGLNNDNMEQGSSGGPWITDYNGVREYANSLQSYHIKDGDTVEYGPFFTADVKGLYDWISNPANRH